MLGYAGNNVVKAIRLGNPDFIYATGLFTLVILAAVLNLLTAHTDTWEAR